MRIMKELNLTTKRDLLPLLTLWSPLGIHGESALYRQMFLSPSMLAQDAAFGDNGYGEFLVDDTEKLMGHTETLRAAFGMTGDEFEQVVTALGFETNFVSVAYTHSQPTLSQVILTLRQELAMTIRPINFPTPDCSLLPLAMR